MKMWRGEDVKGQGRRSREVGGLVRVLGAWSVGAGEAIAQRVGAQRAAGEQVDLAAGAESFREVESVCRLLGLGARGSFGDNDSPDRAGIPARLQALGEVGAQAIARRSVASRTSRPIVRRFRMKSASWTSRVTWSSP